MRTFDSEDVVWHVPGQNQLSGVYGGWDAVLAVLFKIARLTQVACAGICLTCWRM